MKMHKTSLKAWFFPLVCVLWLSAPFRLANAGAVINTQGCAAGTSCTLAELWFGGASFTVNDVYFGNWSGAPSFGYTDPHVFDPQSIIVTPFGSSVTVGYTIEPLVGSNSWYATVNAGHSNYFDVNITTHPVVGSGNPIGAMDLTARFSASDTTADLFLVAHSSLYDPGDGIVASASAQCAFPGQMLGNCLNSQGLGTAIANVAFGPRTALDVSSDIYIGTFGNAVTQPLNVSVLRITESFYRVVPEPTTYCLLAIAFGALLISRQGRRMR